MRVLQPNKLYRIREAANIIKEQVDEDANIIFGSSFDSSLEGKIRVSIVVTGIENKPGSRFKEKALDTTAYIDESFSPATKAEKNFAIDSQDIDDNLERFSAVKTSEENTQEESSTENTDEQNISDIENKTEDEEKSENQETLVAETENSAVEPDFSRFEDFENIEHSGAISEAPQASALFSAIINKSQSNESSSSRETSIADFIPEEKDVFSSTTQINNFENEPVLFPDPEEPSFLSHQEDLKEEEPIVETPSKTKFIDKILGISRARKNRKDTPVIDDRFAEPTAPSFSNTSEALDYSNDIPDNLDIPSFLRRK